MHTYKHTYIHIHTHTHIYVYIYIYIFDPTAHPVPVCFCCGCGGVLPPWCYVRRVAQELNDAEDRFADLWGMKANVAAPMSICISV